MTPERETSAEPDRASVRVRVLLYSGRRDPEWEIGGQEAEMISAGIREALRGRPTSAFPRPPALGFRGFVITTAEDRPGIPSTVLVFGGFVADPDQGRAWPDTAGLEHRLRTAALARRVDIPD